MIRHLMALFATLLAFSYCYAQQPNPNQEAAFQQGKSAGNDAAVSNIFHNINNTTATNTVSGYSTTLPPQANNWNGGSASVGNLLGLGATQQNDCRNGVTGPSAANKKHCDAVNSILETERDLPAHALSSSDPLLLKGKAITADPESIAGAIDGTYSNCTTITKTKLPELELQICEDWSFNEDKTCTVGQIVRVDPDYQYKCQESIRVLNASSCTYGRVITVRPEYNYQCNVSLDQKADEVCHIRAVPVVEGLQGTCETGTVQWFETGVGGLAHDSCQGGDGLWAGFICEVTDNPIIKYKTNGTGQSWFFDQISLGQTKDMLFSNCKMTTTASGSCQNGSCNITLVSAIYTRVNYQGQIHDVHMGTLTLNRSFTAYTQRIRVDYINQCSSQQARAQ